MQGDRPQDHSNLYTGRPRNHFLTLTLQGRRSDPVVLPEAGHE